MNVHALSGYNVAAPPTSQLFGAQGTDVTTSDLYEINTGTGAETSIGPIGFAVTGMAMRPSDNVMFAVTSNNSAVSPRSLITIDMTTGDGTLVGGLFVTNGLADIAFRSDDVLYGFSGNNSRLYTVNTTTGAGTVVNLNQIPGSNSGLGCTFDSADVLYVFPHGDTGTYYSVDEAAVTFTSLGTLSGFSVTSGRIPAAACDASDVVYASLLTPTGAGTHLGTIDVGTGVISDVGATLAKMDALAFSLV